MSHFTLLDIHYYHHPVPRMYTTYRHSLSRFHDTHDSSFNLMFTIFVDFASGFLPFRFRFALGCDSLNFNSENVAIE